MPSTVIADSFKLLRPLGCRVWLAREVALGRDVALKFQADGSPTARAELLAEGAILARCDHPHIVPFYRTIDPGPPAPAFYVMKAFPSTSSTSGTKCRASTLSTLSTSSTSGAARRASTHSTSSTFDLAALASIASALSYLHSLSPPIAHGNIEPESILFDAGGNAFLAGFGKARVVADGNAAPLAEDVRALGVLMRDAFVGNRPRWLGRLLGRMLAEDPVARPSAAEVARALSLGARPSRITFAAAIAFIFAAMAAYVIWFPKQGDVVEEVISPAITAANTLEPKLPPFDAKAMRRIPWYCHLMAFPDDTLLAENEARVAALREVHPDRCKAAPIVMPGATRIIRLPGGVQIEMAAIQWGYFRRGFFLAADSPERSETVMAPGSVLVSRNFWMARTELTRAQYAAVMRVAPAVAGYRARKLQPWEGREGRPLNIEGGDMPVGEDLGLAEVERFIDALNALCSLEGERRFRLPTEAEWEHACRAFVARHFEGEENSGDAAWTRENSGGVPHPAAQKAQNPFGLFDMHGNLAEWCADAYGPLGEPEQVQFDPIAEPASNSAPRVVRGGSFRDGVADCDSDARAPALPTDKGHAIRLVAFP